MGCPSSDKQDRLALKPATCIHLPKNLQQLNSSCGRPESMPKLFPLKPESMILPQYYDGHSPQKKLQLVEVGMNITGTALIAAQLVE
jgi:hypothetical protein